MVRSPQKQDPGRLIETMTLPELCRACGLHAEWIVELVEQGILNPDGPEPSKWQFSSLSITRVRTAWRLHRDLGVNQAGIAITLELIDEIDELHSRLERYQRSAGESMKDLNEKA